MPKVLRNTLLSARDLLVTAGPFLLIALVLLVVAYFALDPTPPKRVVLATGPDQGAYAEFGKRYAAALKQRGIEVQLRNTAGAPENLRLLLDPASGVDLAFVHAAVGEGVRVLRVQVGGVDVLELEGFEGGVAGRAADGGMMQVHRKALPFGDTPRVVAHRGALLFAGALPTCRTIITNS